MQAHAKTHDEKSKHNDELVEKLIVIDEGKAQKHPFELDVVAPELDAGHADALGEIFIHQMIEVIEFVLGSVSNTASYLRLWALSLAHSQLARVFLDMTVLGGVTSHNFIAVVAMYPLFVACTIGVLMVMDLMECFLHALRLHWVEFQNKFFKGDGHKYEPLSFWMYGKAQCEILDDKVE